MNTIQQNIISNVLSTFRNITVENGYDNDLSTKVYEWREYPVDESEFPIVIVRDTDIDFEVENYYTVNLLNLEISILDSGSSTATHLRSLLGDIQKACLEGSSNGWGGYVFDTVPQNVQMDLDHLREIVGDIVFNIQLYFKMKTFDPYSQ